MDLGFENLKFQRIHGFGRMLSIKWGEFTQNHDALLRAKTPAKTFFVWCVKIKKVG